MNRLERYIATTVVGAFLIALGGLLAVFSVINLTEELRDVGVGHYTLPLALWYVGMTLPSEAYELFSAAALVGGTAGLALLATNNELIAISAAGISPQQMVRAVLKTSILLATTAVLLGELMAAPMAEQALAARSIAMSSGQSLSTARGIWAREGSRFIHIQGPADPGAVGDIYFFDFDEERQLHKVTHAAEASFESQRWHLREVSEDLIEESGVIRKNFPEQDWDTHLTPEQLHLLTLPPEQLSVVELSQSVASMRQRGESPQHHLLAFWRRVTMPMIAAIMVFLALPVVLTMPARTPFGYRVALAALLGIGFQMINQTFSSFGLVYGLNAFACATLPAVVALGTGIWRLRAVS